MKKYIPYVFLLIIWLVISIMGNRYTDYDNNLEFNVGRITEHFTYNSVYIYINNDNSEKLNENHNVIITTSTETTNHNWNINSDSKVCSLNVSYKGDLKSITVDGKNLDYSNAIVFSNKISNLIMDYSMFFIIFGVIIISLIKSLIKKNRLKYVEVKEIKNEFKNLRDSNLD